VTATELTVDPRLPHAAGDAALDRPVALLTRPIWGGEAGIRHLLQVAIPLIVSHATHGLNLFLDRMLLAWYAPECFAAALQSGFLSWAVTSFFFGTIAYAGTFVAQYVGANRPREVGPAIWQGLYLALFASGIMAMIAPWSGSIFAAIGHEEPLPALEATYFSILMTHGWAFLILQALLSYWSGRGLTRFVMLVNGLVAAVNFTLNLWLIFDPPAPFVGGMAGAAHATVLANVVGIVVCAGYAFSRRAHAEHRTRDWWPRPQLLFRVIKFGVPSGLHHFVDMLAFTTFMMVVGVFGFEAQFASNIAMNTNFLLFIPAVGLHVACSILAGQFAGAQRPDLTERMNAGALALSCGYMIVVSALYILAPDLFIRWFRGNMGPDEWEPLRQLACTLLIVVAVYSVFDTFILVFSGTLKGAGDTKFCMLVSAVFSQVLLLWPCVAVAHFRQHYDRDTGLLMAWGLCAFYIMFSGLMFALRYRQGKWRRMKVIDEAAVMTVLMPTLDIGDTAPEVPLAG